MHRSTKTPRTPPEQWIRDEDKDEENRYDSPVPDDPPEKPRRTTSGSKKTRPTSGSAKTRRSYSASGSRPDSAASLPRSRRRPEQQLIHTEDDLRTPRQPPPATPPTPPTPPTKPYARRTPMTATPPTPPTKPYAPRTPMTATPSYAPRTPMTAMSSISSSTRARPARSGSTSDDSSAERYRRYSNQKYYNWRSDDSEDELAHHRGHKHDGVNCELCNMALNGLPKRRRPRTIEQLSLENKPRTARTSTGSIVVRRQSIADGDPCEHVEKFVKKRQQKKLLVNVKQK